MLARRNRFFALGAVAAAVAMAIAGAGQAIDANRLSQETLPGGYLAGAVIFVAGNVVGTIGWGVVETGFGEAIGWRRLQLGGGMVATGYLAFGVGTVFWMGAVFASTHDTQYRNAHVANSASALLLGLAVAVGVSGFRNRDRGATRATRLWLAAILALASSIALAVSQLIEQAYWSRLSAPHELTIGATTIAIGAFASGVAALVLARGARRPLPGREASLAAAAAIAVPATLLFAGGEGLLAIAYAVPGEPGSLLVQLWLGVASRVVVAVAFAFVALGARRATRTPA